MAEFLTTFDLDEYVYEALGAGASGFVLKDDPPEPLTSRERDVFRLIARGLSNAEIGHELFISDITVKTHITRLLQKLDLRDRAQAIVLVYQTGSFRGRRAAGLTGREGTPALRSSRAGVRDARGRAGLAPPPPAGRRG